MHDFSMCKNWPPQKQFFPSIFNIFHYIQKLDMHTKTNNFDEFWQLMKRPSKLCIWHWFTTTHKQVVKSNKKGRFFTCKPNIISIKESRKVSTCFKISVLNSWLNSITSNFVGSANEINFERLSRQSNYLKSTNKDGSIKTSASTLSTSCAPFIPTEWFAPFSQELWTSHLLIDYGDFMTKNRKKIIPFQFWT